MKNLFFTLCIGMFAALPMMQAQTDLAAEKAKKAAQLETLEGQLKSVTGQVDALKADLAKITDQLTPYPRWKVGSQGNLGMSFSGFNNWLLRAQPNTTAVNIGGTFGAFANLDQKKYFWRNNANLTLAWLKFDDRDNSDDNNGFQVAADAFNTSSLFGYKLTSKIAISALGEYRTSVLDGRFNDPGYLDLGVGATWTPMSNLVVVFHPLNYNFVFSSSNYDFKSSLGCKIVADYNTKLTKNISWKSNLSAFLSYEGSDLHNYTWINGLSTAYKGVGIGLDLGLRNNKQEALAAGLDNNPLQTFYLLGLSYSL